MAYVAGTIWLKHPKTRLFAQGFPPSVRVNLLESRAQYKRACDPSAWGFTGRMKLGNTAAMASAAEKAAKATAIPEGPFCLSGPIARPAPGQLPLRGDLAHIALAGTHLAAHYVIPLQAAVGAKPLALKLAPTDDAESHAELAAGSAVEVLDIAGDWIWLCSGAQGPAGYCRTSELA